MTVLKKRITQYWSIRARAFADQRLRELDSPKARRWLEEIVPKLPESADNKPLRVLDVGAGTGFFTFLLSPLGYEVVGIDLTPAMIAQAKELARHLNISAEFFVMDAEAPSFAPGSFDAVISRNLTWTLPNLERAYRAWAKLLRPGGVLINFDADYCREHCGELPKLHAHKDISPACWREYEAIKHELQPGQGVRPHWDAVLLREAGFADIQFDHGVWQRIYSEIDEFFNPTPIFVLSARLPQETTP
ncbi:class I SAM-dependent methyltransferase [Sutterella wadsworthensis]|uniref:class I SAM-dependent methyltransferase n=1 Tax=Sutterella wadsworthensis TaxID=40545 RepID=UPI003967CD02